MAAYDSPGYPNQLPGFEPRPAHDYMTAPGTEPGHLPGDHITVTTGLPGSGTVMSLTGSGANLPAQDYSGSIGATGAGEGTAVSTHHPNAGH